MFTHYLLFIKMIDKKNKIQHTQNNISAIDCCTLLRMDRCCGYLITVRTKLLLEDCLEETKESFLLFRLCCCWRGRHLGVIGSIAILGHRLEQSCFQLFHFFFGKFLSSDCFFTFLWRSCRTAVTNFICLLICPWKRHTTKD